VSNCKTGDLAIVLGSHSPNLGMVVTCLELLAPGPYRDDLPRGVSQQISDSEGPMWRTDKPLSWGDYGPYLCLAPDRILRPISPPNEEVRDTTQCEQVR
jgi:hypothetical protein